MRDIDIDPERDLPTDVDRPTHDHRQSMWLIAGGSICWCYQCGAWKMNTSDAPRAWNKPTGIGGANPAMTKSMKGVSHA